MLLIILISGCHNNYLLSVTILQSLLPPTSPRAFAVPFERSNQVLVCLSVMITTIYTSYSTDVCFVSDMTWICIRVHFIFESYLLYLVSFLCSISQYLMQQWKFSYVFLIFFLLFPQGHLNYFSWSIDIYSSRYSLVSLHFTNLPSSSSFLKSLPKLQPELSLEL